MKFDPEVNPILDYIKANKNAEPTRDYAFKQAMRFYSKGKFFETHEILEFQWKKEVGDKRLFIQALIQISISMHKLYVKINLKGAQSQARMAREKLIQLQSKPILTQLGFDYVLVLIENLTELLLLLDRNPMDYSSYSLPEFSYSFDELLK